MFVQWFPRHYQPGEALAIGINKLLKKLNCISSMSGMKISLVGVFLHTNIA